MAATGATEAWNRVPLEVADLPTNGAGSVTRGQLGCFVFGFALREALGLLVKVVFPLKPIPAAGPAQPLNRQYPNGLRIGSWPTRKEGTE